MQKYAQFLNYANFFLPVPHNQSLPSTPSFHTPTLVSLYLR